MVASKLSPFPSSSCVFIALLLVLFCGSDVLPQDILILEEDSSSKKSKEQGSALTLEEDLADTGESYLEVYKKWTQFVQAMEAGDAYRSETALLGIIELRRKNSIPAMPELARSVIEFGDLEWSQKKPEEALKLYRAAAIIDPTLSDAYYSQARVHLSSGIRGLLPATETAIKGWFAPLSSIRGRIYFYSRLLFILLVTLILLGCAFSLILLIKYCHLLVHNALEKYGGRYPLNFIQLVVWVVLFLPVLLFAGPFWLAPFWLFLFWGYAHKSERVLAVFFFVVFALAYPVYRDVADTSGATIDSEISPYITAFVEGNSVKSVSDVEGYYRTHPKDRDAAILLASLYASDNQMDRAVRMLQKHILDHPSDPRAYNNLAAIFFQQEEMDSALKLVQKAHTLDNTNLTYIFNLSRASRATFNFTEANRLLEAAQNAKPKLISQLEETPAEKLVPVLPDDELIWRRIRQKKGSFSSYLYNPFTLAALALLFLAAVINLSGSRKRTLARSCSKCGKAYCAKCQTNTKVSDYCTQCLHIFIKKDGISPASRKEKMSEIGEFTRRQSTLSRISSLILPGAHHLFENATYRGALILLLWFFLLVVLWFNWKFSMTDFQPSGSTTVLNLICFVAIAVLYFLANFSLLRKAGS